MYQDKLLIYNKLIFINDNYIFYSIFKIYFIIDIKFIINFIKHFNICRESDVKYIYIYIDMQIKNILYFFIIFFFEFNL